MSNKPPQELEKQIDELVTKCASGAAIGYTVGEIMAAITSHMQAGFEYAIGPDIHSIIGEYNERDAKVNKSVQEACDFVNYHKGRQRNRAAEWLSGSKENG